MLYNITRERTIKNTHTTYNSLKKTKKKEKKNQITKKQPSNII